MPFTFAHPAAVLPLRKWLWLPGLVAGSLAPDVAYYVPVPGGAAASHSVLGVFGVDVLVGVLLLVVAHMCTAPLLALASDGWRARARPPRLDLSTWRSRVVVPASLVVGAATHLAWDAVTHTDGAAVRGWPLLRVSVVGPHRLYNVIGYVSSLGGLLLLAAAILAWRRRTPPGDHPWTALSPRTRAHVVAGIAVAAALGAAIALADPVSRVSAYDWVRRLLVGATQGTAVSLTLYVLYWHFARPRRTA